MYVVMMVVFVISSLFAFMWGKFMIEYRETEFKGAFLNFFFFGIVSIASMVYLVKEGV